MVESALKVGKTLVRLSLAYATVCASGFVLIVLGFRVGLCAGIGILFYRGLVLVALSWLLTFVIASAAVRWWAARDLGVRDMFSAAVLSLSLNLCFLVVVPVTVDRSISIFLLGVMAQSPDATFDQAAASALFKSIYVDEYRQIDRRLREQAASGNVETVGDGYRISSRGLMVVRIAKFTAWLFDSPTNLVAPRRTARSGRL